MTFERVPWMIGASRHGEPVAITVAVDPTVSTPDEVARNAVAWVGEVRIDGHPVFGHRSISHMHQPVEAAMREAGQRAVAEFALALRNVLGYDPGAFR